MACRKCGKDNGWSYVDLLCPDCKSERGRFLILLAIPLALIAGLVGGILGEVNYDYEMDKCNEMTNDISAYEFSHDVQINAEYNEKCFKLKEHPLSHFGYIAGGIFFGIIMVVILMGMIGLVTIIT